LMLAGLAMILFDLGPALLMAAFGGSCYITVKDEYGQPVEGASVTIVSVTIGDTTYPLNMKAAPTDSRGKTGFSTSTDGTYKIKVSKTGYDTKTKSVTITGGESKSVTFTLTGGPAPEPEPEPEPPTGYWKINGQKVAKDSVVVLPYTQLAVEFVATERAGDIDRVTVKVKDKSGAAVAFTDIDGNKVYEIALTKQDSTRWATIFDLPGDGTYVVEGYIRFGGEELKLLSVIVGPDVESRQVEPTYLTWIGAALAVLGFIMEKRVVA